MERDVCLPRVDTMCATLTGLRSAAHLNGRQGVLRCQEPGDYERWRTRLDDGTWVGGVKALNIEHIHRGNYRRISP